ncbi:helix-turn-helix transcriptional regulator [Rummeliibacillus sp. NPDC094406]|uniref:helix-turn-helix transcriptional regulator n=1 Tax=Rummeliibacillus sp. NPDC094406 TaxID=3364511 RepID=UPI00382B9C1C
MEHIRRTELVHLRKSNSWLQKDVVKKLEADFDLTITESYYGMIEQGTRTPSLTVALAICSLFQVMPNKIFLSENTTKSCG